MTTIKKIRLTELCQLVVFAAMLTYAFDSKSQSIAFKELVASEGNADTVAPRLWHTLYHLNELNFILDDEWGQEHLIAEQKKSGYRVRDSIFVIGQGREKYVSVTEFHQILLADMVLADTILWDYKKQREAFVSPTNHAVIPFESLYEAAYLSDWENMGTIAKSN